MSIINKIIDFFRVGIIFLFLYSIIMFIYIASTDTPLGKGYKMACLEPGCIIFGRQYSDDDVYGNIKKFSISLQYIVGKVSKPNEWMIDRIREKDIKENPQGYFIIDKKNHTTKLKMTKEEFQKECKTLNINCTLKYNAPFWVVYDPYYWYVILMNKFD